MKKKMSITHQQMDSQNWRYKKKLPPTDEFADMNGPVKIIRPAIRVVVKPNQAPVKSELPKYANQKMRNAAYEYSRQMKLGKYLRDII